MGGTSQFDLLRTRRFAPFFATQALGVVVTIAYTAVVTLVICFIVKFTTGFRVSEEAEVEGLDASQHGEAMHD